MFHQEPAVALGSCLDFVSGYKHRMQQETHATSVVELTLSNDVDELWHFACNACQDVLNSEGRGGPVDHTLIAKAVLAICAARAVENKEREDGIW